MNARLEPTPLGPFKTLEERIDAAERQMLQADNRTDREMFCRAFLQAIKERNDARTPDETTQLETEMGLRR